MLSSLGPEAEFEARAMVNFTTVLADKIVTYMAFTTLMLAVATLAASLIW